MSCFFREPLRHELLPSRAAQIMLPPQAESRTKINYSYQASCFSADLHQRQSESTRRCEAPQSVGSIMPPVVMLKVASAIGRRGESSMRAMR